MKSTALATARSFAIAFTAVFGLSHPLAAQETPAAVRVQLSPLSGVWQQPQREAAAEIVPRNASRLSAETSGVLQRWTADVGTRVQRGQVLAQIDPRDAELAVQRARAALQASDARLKLDLVNDHLAGKDVAAAGKAAWFAQREADDGCALLAATLYAAKQLPAAEVWRRARVAIDGNKPRTAQQAVVLVAPQASAEMAASAKGTKKKAKAEPKSTRKKK